VPTYSTQIAFRDQSAFGQTLGNDPPLPHGTEKAWVVFIATVKFDGNDIQMLNANADTGLLVYWFAVDFISL